MREVNIKARGLVESTKIIEIIYLLKYLLNSLKIFLIKIGLFIKLNVESCCIITRKERGSVCYTLWLHTMRALSVMNTSVLFLIVSRMGTVINFGVFSLPSSSTVFYLSNVCVLETSFFVPNFSTSALVCAIKIQIELQKSDKNIFSKFEKKISQRWYSHLSLSLKHHHKNRERINLNKYNMQL